jgi:hypothetical protein
MILIYCKTILSKVNNNALARSNQFWRTYQPITVMHRTSMILMMNSFAGMMSMSRRMIRSKSKSIKASKTKFNNKMTIIL